MHRFQKEISMYTEVKNIEKNQVVKMAEQVDYQPGQVISKTLAQSEYVSITVFSFEKGEEISTFPDSSSATSAPMAMPTHCPAPIATGSFKSSTKLAKNMEFCTSQKSAFSI